MFIPKMKSSSPKGKTHDGSINIPGAHGAVQSHTKGR